MKYIFQIKIKDGHTEQEYVSAWKKGSAIIQKSEGAQGTVLYRKIGEPGLLLAIAEWESKAARDAAMQKLEGADGETQKIRYKHTEFASLEKLGHFEEIARVDFQ